MATVKVDMTFECYLINMELECTIPAIILNDRRSMSSFVTFKKWQKTKTLHRGCNQTRGTSNI
jgi:hypothetical protein